MIGQKFYRLLVLLEVPQHIAGGRKYRRYLCACDCGKKFITFSSNIRSGAVKSCGCLLRESTGNRKRSHGMCKSSEYGTWESIKQRCLNKNDPSWPNYGGRGITICQEWIDSFEIFSRDIGKRPSEKHTIDRVDVNKGYSKQNCRWATKAEQIQNRRNSVFVVWRDQRIHLTELAKLWGCPYGWLYNRVVRKKIPPEEVFLIPR